MDIYWIQDHEQKGPLPEVEVISMLEAGLIPENARAWHAGCPEWVCIRDLPALKGAGAVSRGEGERRNREEEGLENAGEEQSPALAADADCPQEGKSAKRRQWRMKQAGFEEVPRLAGTTVPGNRAARRWAREPLPYAGHDTLAKGGVVVIGRRAGGSPPYAGQCVSCHRANVGVGLYGVACRGGRPCPPGPDNATPCRAGPVCPAAWVL